MEAFKIDPGISKDSVALKELINRILDSFMPLALKQKNEFQNDVPNLHVHTDSYLLGRVITGLFGTIMRQCENSCIRLSAKSFHNVVLVHITSINGFQGVHAMEEMDEIESLAEKLGGCILYNNQHLKESTFTLSFFDYDS